MRFKFIAVSATALAISGGSALACETLDQAMEDFRAVADAFSAQAQSMSPDKFPIWTSEVEQFSDAMGQQNYVGACEVLSRIVGELDLNVTLAHAAPAAATPAPAPTTEGGTNTAAAPPRGDSSTPVPAAPQAETPQTAPAQVEAPRSETTPRADGGGGGWDTPAPQAGAPEVAAPQTQAGSQPQAQPLPPVATPTAPPVEPAVVRPGRDRSRPPRLW